MFKNDTLHKNLNKERKFARQFVIAAILTLIVNANALFYIMSQIEKLPTAYWIQLAFIPLLLSFMAIHFFRLHRKITKQIQEDYSSEVLNQE